LKDLPGFRQSFCEPDSTRLTVYFRSKVPHKTWQVWFSSLDDIGDKGEYFPPDTLEI